MNSMERQKDRTQKDELPRSVGAQYATGDQKHKIRHPGSYDHIYYPDLGF